MNRRFRLAALERLRHIRLEEATRALAAARRAAAGALAARDAVAAQLAATVPAQRTAPGTAASAGERRELLRERLAAAQQTADDAAHEAQQALQAWQTARADLKIVQALHARHRAAVAVAVARREQRDLDDLAGQVALRTQDAREEAR
jgi:flagellar biosynthesis chaperone FliJ